MSHELPESVLYPNAPPVYVGLVESTLQLTLWNTLASNALATIAYSVLADKP